MEPLSGRIFFYFFQASYASPSRFFLLWSDFVMNKFDSTPTKHIEYISIGLLVHHLEAKEVFCSSQATSK